MSNWTRVRVWRFWFTRWSCPVERVGKKARNSLSQHLFDITARQCYISMIVFASTLTNWKHWAALKYLFISIQSICEACTCVAYIILTISKCLNLLVEDGWSIGKLPYKLDVSDFWRERCFPHSNPVFKLDAHNLMGSVGLHDWRTWRTECFNLPYTPSFHIGFAVPIYRWRWVNVSHLR